MVGSVVFVVERNQQLSEVVQGSVRLAVG